MEVEVPALRAILATDRSSNDSACSRSLVASTSRSRVRAPFAPIDWPCMLIWTPVTASRGAGGR